MRLASCVAVGALLLAGNVSAQATTAKPTSPALRGTWHGTSICTKEAAASCHDETVVYVFNANGERISWVADKIVNGVQENMGTLDCAYDARAHRVSCPMRGWLWSLDVRADTMSGTLRSPEGEVWRNVHVVRRAAH